MLKYIGLLLFIISMCYINDLLNRHDEKVKKSVCIVPEQYKPYMKSQNQATNLEDYPNNEKRNMERMD